jgi:NhaP-type Na+/H+ or K+/H+ antiporter
VAYAALSLTLVRMLPVAVALAGTGMPVSSVALMGWFGPRGLASIVFLTISLISFEAAGEDGHALVGAIGWTIGLSVLLHGITASPVGRWYGSRASGTATGPSGSIAQGDN